MTDTLFLLLAAFMVGLSKGGLASAAAIAVPMLALFMNPVKAAATLLPVYIITDWIGVWLYRRNFSRRNVAILVPSLLFGVFIATIITPYTPEAVLLIFTGCIGLWFCARAWLKRKDEGKAEAHILPGIFWGTLTGIASFITHSGGPPSQAYLLPQKLPKLEFAGTIALTFAVGNLVKLPAYYAIGQMEGLNWGLIAQLAAAGIVGTLVGRYLTRILPEAIYMRVIQILLFALSCILFVRGMMDLTSGA
nr:sulfite exporter TauE/SafE family protein [uncultured Cohaesibacter sp.]